MRESPSAEAQCPAVRRPRLASFPTQCLLGLLVSAVVVAGYWGAGSAAYRRDANRALHSLCVQAISAPAPVRAEAAGANAAHLWLRAAAAMEEEGLSSGRRRHTRALALARRAAAGGRCEFPRARYGATVDDALAPLGAAATLGPLADMGRGPARYGMMCPTGPAFPCGKEVAALARLLADGAADAARGGEMAQACERLREGFVLSRHLCQGSDAAGVLCAIAVDGTMVAAAAQVLGAGTVPVGEAKRLSAELAGLDHTAAIVQELEAQRQRLLSCGRQSRPAGPIGLPGRLARAADELCGRPEARLLQALGDLECAKEILARPWGEQGRASTQPTVPRAAQIAATRIAVCACAGAAFRSLLQAALALQHYRARNGRYPDHLADACADGFEISSDVYSGQPLVYEAEGSRVTLRSVGLDRAEDAEGSQGDDIIWVSL